MLQPLYLDGARSPLTVLPEGPALRIRQEGVADFILPLRRIARVLVRGTRVQWRTEALTNCLRAGVPVIFVGAGGAVLGGCYALSVPCQRQGLAGVLAERACEPDLPGRLDAVLRACERAAILQLLQVARWTLADLRPHAVASACRERLPAEAAGMEAQMAALCTALVLAGLSRAGVGPRFLADCAGGFPLAERLAAVLAWSLWPALWRLGAYLRRHGSKHAEEQARSRRAARAFEAEAPRLENAPAALTARLITALSEENMP